MDEITADHDAFRAAVADLGRAATDLRAGRDRAARSVDALLGTWSGTVASSYAEGFDTWTSGAARVLDALETMTGLLGAVDADLMSVDAAAGASLGVLAARLG